MILFKFISYSLVNNTNKNNGCHIYHVLTDIVLVMSIILYKIQIF